MAMTCAGCKTLLDSPSAPQVQIPRDCEDLAKEVPYPPVSVGQSAKASAAQHRAALGEANGNLRATRECQAQQREHYAGR